MKTPLMKLIIILKEKISLSVLELTAKVTHIEQCELQNYILNLHTPVIKLGSVRRIRFIWK